MHYYGDGHNWISCHPPRGLTHIAQGILFRQRPVFSVSVAINQQVSLVIQVCPAYRELSTAHYKFPRTLWTYLANASDWFAFCMYIYLLPYIGCKTQYSERY